MGDCLRVCFRIMPRSSERSVCAEQQRGCAARWSSTRILQSGKRSWSPSASTWTADQVGNTLPHKRHTVPTVFTQGGLFAHSNIAWPAHIQFTPESRSLGRHAQTSVKSEVSQMYTRSLSGGRLLCSGTLKALKKFKLVFKANCNSINSLTLKKKQLNADPKQVVSHLTRYNVVIAYYTYIKTNQLCLLYCGCRCNWFVGGFSFFFHFCTSTHQRWKDRNLSQKTWRSLRRTEVHRQSWISADRLRRRFVSRHTSVCTKKKLFQARNNLQDHVTLKLGTNSLYWFKSSQIVLHLCWTIIWPFILLLRV